MSISTERKRKSIASIGLMCIGPSVVADGSLSSVDRQIVGYGYARAAAAPPRYYVSVILCKTSTITTRINSASTATVIIDRDSTISSCQTGEVTEVGKLLSLATADNNIVLTAEQDIFTSPAYDEQDADTEVYVRNPNRLAPEINLTCVSPWNEGGGNLRGGIAITPRNYVCAHHSHPAANATIRFVTLDGTVVDRTVEHTERVSNDLQIGRLDEDLPISITPASLLPEGGEDYISDADCYDGAVFFTDQEEKLFVGRASTFSGFNMGVRESDNYPGLWKLPVGGDSGSPAFIVVDGIVVALFSHLNPYYSPTIHRYRDAGLLEYCAVTGDVPETLDLGDYEQRI